MIRAPLTATGTRIPTPAGDDPASAGAAEARTVSAASASDATAIRRRARAGLTGRMVTDIRELPLVGECVRLGGGEPGRDGRLLTDTRSVDRPERCPLTPAEEIGRRSGRGPGT